MHCPELERAIVRLMRINWNPKPELFELHLELLREHFRRLSLVLVRVGSGQYWPGGCPVFDLLRSVDSLAEVDDPRIELCMTELTSTGNIIWPQLQTCRSYLRWTAASRVRDSVQRGLPEPYEPLLLMYENGGWFALANDGRADIDLRISLSWHSPAWFAKQMPLIQLDEGGLERYRSVAGSLPNSLGPFDDS